MVKVIRAAVVVLVMLAGASTAQAEPFVIEAGSGLGLDFEGDGFSFSGKNFFIQTLPNMSGNFGPFYTDGTPAFRCDPCVAGSEFNPSFQTNDVFLGAGDATFGSTTYSNVSLFGTFDFIVTPLAFPSSTLDGLQVQTPFSFNGTIRGVDINQQVFNAAFVGTGHVLRFYDRLDDGRYVGGENQIAFVFDSPSTAPVPEPTTLLLVGTGTAAALARARSRAIQDPGT